MRLPNAPGAAVAVDRKEGLLAVYYSHHGGTTTLREFINVVAYIACDDQRAEAARVRRALDPPVDQGQRGVFTLTPEREAIVRDLAKQGWTVESEG